MTAIKEAVEYFKKWNPPQQTNVTYVVCTCVESFEEDGDEYQKGLLYYVGSNYSRSYFSFVCNKQGFHDEILFHAKSAVEIYGAWPEGAISIAHDRNGDFHPMYDNTTISTSGECTFIYEVQFNHAKETKMKEVKFKSIPVTDMDIWDLGKAVAGGGEFYDDEGCSLFVASESIQSDNYIQELIAIKLKQGKITTRQPIPWYEVDGVFPCLGRTSNGRLVEAVKIENESVIDNLGGRPCSIHEFKRLNEEEINKYATQAAEYGVGV